MHKDRFFPVSPVQHIILLACRFTRRIRKVKVAIEEISPMQTDQPMSALKQMSRSTMEVPPLPPSRASTDPTRNLERNKSGPQGGMMGRRAPPKRSQSSRIGRPAFNKDAAAQDFVRTPVNRSNSSKFTRAAPVRSGSFSRAVPDRSASTSSLRAYRKQKHATPLGQQIEIPYSQRGGGDGDCDSVFTTASTQTLDSIMLRKKQIHVSDANTGVAVRKDRHALDSVGSESFDFDESLHTVDSIRLHMRNVHQVMDEQCDLSVFSESFASTDTYALSDYEEDEDERLDAAMQQEFEEDLEE